MKNNSLSIIGLMICIALFVQSCSSVSNIEFEVNGVKFKMIAVEGGSFMMGATPGQGAGKISLNETPVHKVTVGDFYIGETEVTQDLWFAVMEKNPSFFKKNDGNYPVESVSWYDVQDFVNRLNEITGEQFRLPFESEWEYVAKGGKYTTDNMYAGSDDIDEVAWYKGNASYTTHAVATKKANELGVYDMTGNVFEITQDLSADIDFPMYTIRGGAISNDSTAWCLHVSSRRAYPIKSKANTIGVRLAMCK